MTKKGIILGSLTFLLLGLFFFTAVEDIQIEEGLMRVKIRHFSS